MRGREGVGAVDMAMRDGRASSLDAAAAAVGVPGARGVGRDAIVGV